MSTPEVHHLHHITAAVRLDLTIRSFPICLEANEVDFKVSVVEICKMLRNPSCE